MQTINIVCVNWRDYQGRGPEYVNKLYKAVKRNTTLPFRFFCFTDNPTGLMPGVEVIALPAGLKGWWNKLAIFAKQGLPFGRAVYLDLDTVIVGNIDKLLEFNGHFAMLRDLMRPKLYGSGVMAWSTTLRSGNLWDKYIEEGQPQYDPEGDQGFIANHLGVEPEILQNHVDGIYSYKVHCKGGLPSDARIICFHGLPRPHQVNDDWVQENWV